jgi:hypothetical protein
MQQRLVELSHLDGTLPGSDIMRAVNVVNVNELDGHASSLFSGPPIRMMRTTKVVESDIAISGRIVRWRKTHQGVCVDAEWKR